MSVSNVTCPNVTKMYTITDVKVKVKVNPLRRFSVEHVRTHLSLPRKGWRGTEVCRVCTFTRLWTVLPLSLYPSLLVGRRHSVCILDLICFWAIKFFGLPVVFTYQPSVQWKIAEMDICKPFSLCRLRNSWQSSINSTDFSTEKLRFCVDFPTALILSITLCQTTNGAGKN